MQTRTLRASWVPGGDRLLVVLHGRGDSAEGFRWLPGALALDGLSYLLVNAPDPYWTGFSWYGLPPDHRPGIARSRRALDALFDEIEAAGFPPARTALLGFSQGALMTLSWGVRSPRALAGYVALSGWLEDAAQVAVEAAPHAARPVWLVTHGTRDDVLPLAATEAQVRVLVDAGVPIRWEVHDKDHTVDPVVELPRVRRFLAERLGLTG